MAACLSHMIYDLKAASRKTWLNMKKSTMAGPRAGLCLPSTAGLNSRPEKRLSIPHEDDQMCSSAIKAGGGGQ